MSTPVVGAGEGLARVRLGGRLADEGLLAADFAVVFPGSKVVQ